MVKLRKYPLRRYKMEEQIKETPEVEEETTEEVEVIEEEDEE
jgi:hypothetical protein